MKTKSVTAPHLQLHYPSRPLQRSHCLVMRSFPQIFAVHGQDGVSNVELASLVRGHALEDFADEDRHLVLATPFDADAEPVVLFLHDTHGALERGDLGCDIAGR